jgi:hypothetical protein
MGGPQKKSILVALNHPPWFLQVVYYYGEGLLQTIFYNNSSVLPYDYNESNSHGTRAVKGAQGPQHLAKFLKAEV